MAVIVRAGEERAGMRTRTMMKMGPRVRMRMEVTVKMKRGWGRG
jgi:hypothetical protein